MSQTPALKDLKQLCFQLFRKEKARETAAEPGFEKHSDFVLGLVDSNILA
jgi:hypothetical protein